MAAKRQTQGTKSNHDHAPQAEHWKSLYDERMLLWNKLSTQYIKACFDIVDLEKKLEALQAKYDLLALENIDKISKNND